MALSVLLILGVLAVPVATPTADAALPSPTPDAGLVSFGQYTGASGAGASGNAGISADGVFVGFTSANQLAEDEDGEYVDGTHVYVSGSNDGPFVVDAAMRTIADPADVVVSAGGQYLAFTAQRSVSDPDAGRSVYTVDVTTQVITRIDPDISLVTTSPSISDDGLRIAYDAASVADPDARQVKVWRRSTRTNSLVSGLSGAGGNAPSWGPAISGDGSVVAFTSAATNLVVGMEPQPRNEAGGIEALAADLTSGTVSLLSNSGSATTTAAQGDSWIPGPASLSTDATWAVFATDAPAPLFDDQVSVDANGTTDLVRRDRTTGAASLISRAASATCSGASPWGAVDGGGVVVFASTCTNLTGSVFTSGADVYQSDGTGDTVLVSHRAGTTDPARDTDVALLRPTVSATGDTVAWTTPSSLGQGWPSDENGLPDVYRATSAEGAYGISGVEVAASSIRDACPDPTLTVVVDYPIGSESVDLIDESLNLGYRVRVNEDRVTASPAPGDDYAYPYQTRTRALVLELATADGTRFVVWDGGASGIREFGSMIPGAVDTPLRVALCTPARPSFGPRAYPDTAAAVSGSTVQIDVLANDEGDLDRSSLTIDSVSGGAASVAMVAGAPIVAYTAPTTGGVETIRYTVSDYTGTTASAIVTINVAALQAHPLDLALTRPTVAPDTATPVQLTVTNNTGDPVDGTVVSVRADQPATLEAGGGAWSCTRSPDLRTATCSNPTTTAEGTSFAAVPVTVRTPNGPQLPCVANEPTGPACVHLHAWNGDAAAEGIAAPTPTLAALPYAGGVLRAAVVDSGPFATGSLAGYTVHLSNIGAAVLPVGTTIDVRSGQADMPFVGGSSEQFSCMADPADPTRGICTTSVVLASSSSASLPLLFQTGAGQATGCPPGVAPPCALLDVAWIDAIVADRRVPLASIATEVHDAVNVIPPDAAVQLAHPSVAWSGQSTSVRALVKNAGMGPTTGPLTVAVVLPEGMTATGTISRGWTCTIGATTTCTRATPLAAGSLADTITVIADVDIAATDGLVTAAVSTPDDADASNNSMSDLLVVRNGDLDDPDGPAHLLLEVDSALSISTGATVDVSARLRNHGTTEVAGPLTISLLVPDGLPAGQVVGVVSTSAAWSCIDSALTGVRQVRCRTTGSVAAGGVSPDLQLAVTGHALSAGGTLDLTFGHSLDDTPVTMVRRLFVTAPQVTSLALTSTLAQALRAGGEAELVVRGTNVGNAAPDDDLYAQVRLPAGVTLASIEAPDWTCTGTQVVDCTSTLWPLPGTDLPPLVLRVSAAADAPIGTGTALVEVRTADAFGPRTASNSVPISIQAMDAGELGVVRLGLTGSTTADRTLDYQIQITNQGRVTTTGDLVVSEVFPAGTSGQGTGQGWSCATTSTTLRCTASDIELDAGAAAPLLDVHATLPAGLGGGQAQLSAVASLAGSTGTAADAVAVPAAVVHTPSIDVRVAGDPLQLVRGSQGVATVQVDNVGTGAQTGSVVVGLVLSRGLLPTTATGEGWTCLPGTGTVQPVVACRRDGGVPAGAALPAISAAFQVAETSPDQALLGAGVVAGGATVPLATVVTKLAGGGTSVLTNPGTDLRPVRGLHVSPGADQTVPERTPSGSGTSATQVRLDGRGSSSGSDQIAWSWTQVQGPAVVWAGPTGEAVAADGTPRPTGRGATPSFTVPRLADSTTVVLSFELAVTAAGATGTDTVDITVTPTPDTAPVVDAIISDLDDVAEAPPAGAPVELSTTVTDPEGDAVSVRWAIASSDGALATSTIHSADEVITEPGGAASASMAWPEHASYVVVEATAASARGTSTTRSLRIAKALTPPSISVTAPSAADGGESVTLHASLDVGDADGAIWRWQQDSGPLIDTAALQRATGPTLTFDAPWVATEGEVMTFTAVLTRVAGLATSAAPASASIRLAPLPVPQLTIEGDSSIARNVRATLRVSGAPAGSTVRWTQQAGPAGSFTSPQQSSTGFTGDFDGTAAISVDVTDPTGRVTSATTELPVGTVFSAGRDAACTTSGSLFNQAFAQAASGGTLSTTVGPVSLSLAGLRVDSPCRGASPTVSFSNATFSVAGGTVTGSGLSGRIAAGGVCITSGMLRFPTSWGLQSAVLGSTTPICVSLVVGENPVTGSITVTGIPFLTLPSGVAPPTTTVTFDGAALAVASTAGLPGGGSLDLAVTVDLDTGHLSGSVDGELAIMDTPVAFAGAVSYDGTTLDLSIEGSTPGPIQVVAGTRLTDVSLRLGRDGFTVGATVSIADAVDLTASGAYTDASHWSLAVSGRTGSSDWSPISGLTLPATEFSGSIARDGGPVVVDASVVLPTAWQPSSGLKISSLTARLSNTPVPAGCPSVAAGSVWLALEGSAEATFDAATVQVDGRVCVVPGQRAWSFSTSATLDSWAPSSSLDVSIESLGLQASSDGTRPLEVLAFGSARAFGVSLGAVVSVQGRSVVVDAAGSFAGLRTGVDVPGASTGHVLFATSARPSYAFYRSGALPTIDPALGSVNVPAGASLYAGFTLSAAVQELLTQHLHLPPVSSVVVSATLGGPAPTLRATASFGGTNGYTLYEHCGGTCSTDTRTRLALRAISLTLSGTGSVGLAADAKLELPRSSQTAASALDLTARITVDMAGPSLAVALYTTDGRWDGALGVPDLVLSELAVQAGIEFGTVIPTPSLGFGATIEHLPESWASTIGMDPVNQEPMHVGINLSLRNPIFDLQIGVADGHTAIDPLAPVGAPGILKIDYASLVIAPFGGTIGDRVYPAGMSLGFAASIAGVPLDAAFAVDPMSGSVQGAVQVGEISLAGFRVSNVAASFDLQPKNLAKPFAFKVSGDFVLPSLGSGPTVVQGALEVTVGSSGLRGALAIRATGIGLAGVAMLDVLDLKASLAVEASRPPDVALDVTAQATIFGSHVAVSGNLKVVSGKLTSLSMALSVDATLGPVALTGTGCGGSLGTSGACVRFAYASGKITASLTATIKVSGFDVTISGELTETYVRAAAKLDVAGVGTFALTGALYFGSNSALTGITAADLNGTLRQVKQGDFSFTLGAKTTGVDLGGFRGSVGVTVSRVGDTSGVLLKGAVTVPGGSVRGSGLFSVASGKVLFDFAATGNLKIDGHAIAMATVHVVKDTAGVRAAVTAKVDLPFGSFGSIITADLAGTFSASSAGLRYDLTGNVAFLAQFGKTMSLTASLRFTNATFSFSINLGAATVFNVTMKGTVSSNSTFQLSASTSFLGVGASITAFHDIYGWRFRAQVSYEGRTFAEVWFEDQGFAARVAFVKRGSGELNLEITKIGGSFTAFLDLGLTISRSGSTYNVSASFDGSATVSAWFKTYGCSGAGCLVGIGWGWQRHSLGTYSASLSSSGRICAGIKGKEICI